jgi:hypothetical protein
LKTHLSKDKFSEEQIIFKMALAWLLTGPAPKYKPGNNKSGNHN